MMIQVLWYRQSDAIIDVKIGDSDADSYKYIQWQCSWISGKLSIRIGTLSTDTINGNVFLRLLFIFGGMLGRESLVVLA